MTVTGSELSKRIHKSIEKNFDAQVKFLAKLVQEKSANPFTPETSSVEVPIEKEVAHLIYKKLNSFGLSPKYIGASKQRPNVVCSYGVKRYRKSLILNGHMDTVMPSNVDGKNAFSGKVSSGRLYGLGALDMKGSLSAYIYAVKALMDAGIELDGRLVMAFVVDEEPGACSEWGTKYLLGKGVKAKAAMIGEPGSEVVAIGHRGGYRFKLTTKGQAIHTGVSAWEKKKAGQNAVVDMAEVINALKNLEVPYKPAKLFPGRKPVFTFPTKIEGGVSINIVPDKCVAYGDVRLMPGNAGTQVRLLMEEKLSKLSKVNYSIENVLFVPAVEIDSKEELVQSLVKVIGEVMKISPEIRGVGPWSDAWMYVAADIPAIGGFGPDGEGMHQANEWVSLESLKKITEVYARLAVDYLGIK
jgi:acetylornithine deacetylase/succinyl-diaminopimelate desuccinylase family protein